MTESGMHDPSLDVEIVRDLPAQIDPIDVVTAAPARMWTRGGVTNIGPLAQDLPEMLQRMLGDRADVIALSGLLWGAVSQLFNRLGPLQQVADEMPHIVAHSDEVHTELKQGLDAIRTAVAAVQQAAGSLGTSLTPIAQLAAQAQAAAAIASATATAAGQRCAALEARVDTLEARRPRMWRAAGNLPTLALGATVDVLCPWSTAPSPLPTVEQCGVVLVVGGVTASVKSVSATGVTVTAKATVLLPTPGALQVMATTW